MRGQAPNGIPGLNRVFQLLWAFVYRFAEKKIKTSFRADEQCVQCGLCVKQCPNEAIQIGKSTVNKFRWKGPMGDFKPSEGNGFG